MNPTFVENETADFDREYFIEELLPPSALIPLIDSAAPLNEGAIWILGLDGKEIYRYGETASNLAAAVKKTLESKIGNQEPLEVSSERALATCFAVIHEMVPIAYLALEGPVLRTKNLGLFLSACLNRLAQANCRSLMAAGIHGQVVSESHRKLIEKAALLEASQKKYRKLAQNLKKEVARQTSKIQSAQARFMHQEKLASIGQLAAGVAHEINNPMGFISSNLNTLVGYQQDFKTLVKNYREMMFLLKEKTSASDTAIYDKIEIIEKMEKEIDLEFLMADCGQLVQESLEGAERIRKIVSDLKDFAHPGERSLKLSDINRSIDATLSIATNELKYNTQVVRNYNTLPQILCYPQQLNQVFLNILINAAQSIEERGEIRIETRCLGECVEIRFSDNGCGISPEKVSKIFDPFFTTKPVGKGTGLGLNVAHNIIQKHHGTINVESQPGQGTTFIIRIPVNPPNSDSCEVSCPD